MKATDKTKKKTKEAADMASSIIKDFIDSADDFSAKTRDATVEATEKSVEFIKKYPVQSAIGATVLGYVFGLFSSRKK